jgi:hypothetical protein
MEEKRNAYRLLVGQPEGKGPLGRPRCRWVDNIEMDLREIGWDRMDRTGCSRVDAGSSTSTVTLQVVGGNEKGCLESETVKYGRESHWTRTRE